MGKIRFNKVFKQFLLSYLLAWIVPIAIGSVAYYKTFDTVQQNAVESTVSMLEQSSIMIDGRLSEIQNMVDQIINSRNLNFYLNQGNQLYQFETLRSDLINYRITNNFIESIHVCLKDKKVVVSTDYITDKTDKFFEYNLTEMGFAEIGSYNAFTALEFPGEFIVKPANGNDSDTVISHIESFPRGSKTPKGIIIVNIKARELKRLLGAVLQENEWLYISDEQGNIVTSIPDNIISKPYRSDFLRNVRQKESRITGNDFIITNVSSQKYGWTYVAGFSKRSIMSRVEDVRNFTIWVAAVMLLSGLLIAALMANRNSKPINRLVEMIKGTAGDDNRKNAFDLLSGSISELLENNEKLKNEIIEKVPLLKAAFTDRLLRGGFNSANEMKIAMHSSGLDIKGEKYTVMLIKVLLDGYEPDDGTRLLDEFNMAKMLISRVVQLFFPDEVLLHEVGKDTLAAVFAFSFDDDVQIRNVINSKAVELHQYLEEKNNIHVRFAAGMPYNNLFDVYRSFDEALQASGYKALEKGDFVIWYLKSSIVSSYYYYPVEIENKIINLVKVGDSDGISTLLDRLHDENINNRKIDKDMASNLVDEMKGTFIRLIPQVNFDDEEFVRHIREKVDVIDRLTSIEDIWKHIRSLYSLICSRINNYKNEYSSLLKSRIIAFIHTNYMDQQMNRYAVASEFGLSEDYLSRIFKEQTGVTLSKYLEQVRMEKAKEMIEMTELPINDIAESVGYSSAHAFRRVYKRFYGILPSEVR